MASTIDYSSVDEGVLRPDHLLDVLNEIPTLQNEPEDLAIALGLLPSCLPPQARLKEVITLWLARKYDISKHGPPSWRSLVRAVASPVGGRNPALAKRVAKKYPVGSVTSQPVLVTAMEENIGPWMTGTGQQCSFLPPSNPAERQLRGTVPYAHSTHSPLQFGDVCSFPDDTPVPKPDIFEPDPKIHPKLTFMHEQIIPKERDHSRGLGGPALLYRMMKSPHGMAVIINNSHFTRHSYREGTELDAENLKNTFRFLDYLVYQYTNCTAASMVKIFHELKEQEAVKASDSFVCCILSHGRLGEIIGSDSVGVSIHTLTDKLSDYNCPALAGKPKLFFVQACRGEGGAEGSSQIKSANDFLFSYATPPGKVAYRDADHGSWYISELCKALCTYGRCYQLSDILLSVHNDVDEMYKKFHIHQQFCIYESSLNKSVYF